MNRQSVQDYKELSFLAYYNNLKKYCYFLTKNKWEAEDLAQEAMLKAFQHYGAEVEIKPSLLKKIAYHKWLDTVRRRNFELVTNDVEENQQSASQPPNQIMESLELLLGTLTAKQSVIYILKEVFLFQIKEISLLMGTTETAVKSSLHRSKKRLLQLNEESTSNQDESETGILLETLYHAIQKQDPQLLIHRIPFLRSLTTQADLTTLSMNRKPSSSPTLYMAA